MLEFFNQL